MIKGKYGSMGVWEYGSMGVKLTVNRQLTTVIGFISNA